MEIEFTKEQERVLDYLAQNNGKEYNMHKAAEEFQELALVLTQKLLKPTKVEDKAIIDEIGDAVIRLAILKRMYNIPKILSRVDFKLGKYKEYLDHETYKQI